MFTENRILTLDGWRGIAILLVLAEHAAAKRYEYQTWASLGSLGVDIFFVLSGFIITSRLIEERTKSSTIDLPGFYIRRAFRILPLVVCYLCVICALGAFFPLDIRHSQIAASLFFFRNYLYASHHDGIYTTHFWSLSIEEHFYLLWPAMLLRFGNRRALWIAAIGACACAMWRIYDLGHPMGPIGRFLPGATMGLRTLRTDTRLDGLLLGSTLAILLTDRRVRDFIQRNFPKETPLLCGTLLILNEQWLGGRATLTNYILISLMIASTLMVHEGLVYKWLKFRPLVWIGTISYSLYIWQQLFLLHPPGNISLAVFSVAPLNIISAFAIASCSYYLIERPIIRLAHRWSNRSPANSVTDTTAGVNSSAVYPINVYEVAALPSPSLAD